MPRADRHPAPARSRRAVGVRAEAGGEWGVVVGDPARPALHAVLDGTVWIRLAQGGARRLGPGDAVWLPAGTPHALASNPDAFAQPCDVVAGRRSQVGGRRMRLGHSSPDTRMLTVRYDGDADDDALTLLPRAQPLLLEPSAHPALDAALSALEAELSHPQMHRDSATETLADLLLVHVSRTAERYVASAEGGHVQRHAGPVIRDAQALVRRHPEQAWTTESLAAAVRVSRATLHRHFEASLGISPLAQVTAWRMHIASVRLRETDESVGSIGRSVGYASPHAFSRAFRRSRGQTPREYRTAARAPQ
ncbi:AraC family transcriptional regulator [Microbacterium sp. ET2]|uniref:AraC family transcriptional regulator n=1 Tax=Microbacterium albipurpureum TaxID=3050384 RepID=UPI00259C8DB0|nr:AraC family transcriptional regulator [Microbacterium sp. ET2 (Ac-2212)]WJL96622.1 AraC family transcriptional regulator [Microbacterium sp. ET2 (Ac-2212)]